MTHRKVKILVLTPCIYILAAILIILPVWSGGSGSTQNPPSTPQLPVKTEAEIRAILTKWRDKIKPTLDPKWVAEVEKQAAKLPIETPAGQLPITYEDNEDQSSIKVNPKANRRDWAYALDGFLFTYLGGNCEGQETKLDLGFWCFLEAALLHLIPDHLASVAFHLNERGEYDDAIAILTYAKSLHPYHPSILNNLAYAYSMKGNHKSAYDLMSQAAVLRPDDQRYQKKLKFYADKAGVQSKPPGKDSTSTTPAAMIYSDTYLSLMPSLMIAAQEFYKEFMWNRWNVVFNKCFSGTGNSAEARYFNSLGQSDKEHEQCVKNCYPAPGIIPHDINKCICTCSMIRCQKNYANAMAYYDESRTTFEKWEKETHTALELLVEEMADLMIKNQKSLKSHEIEFMEKFITDTYLHNADAIKNLRETDLDGAYSAVIQEFEALKNTSLDCGKALSVKEPQNPSDFFGKRPKELVLKRVSDSNKVWHIWFFFGDLKLYPDDTAKLSVGIKGVASLKLKYNFATGDHGAGLGLGLNLQKALGPLGPIAKNTMKFEFFMERDSKTGFNYGLETGLRPKIGAAHVDPSDLVIRLEN